MNAVATENQPADPKLVGTVFAEYPQRENFLLALAWWRANGFDEAALYSAARTFKLGRHRLTRVGEHEVTTYTNVLCGPRWIAAEGTRKACPIVLTSSRPLTN